MFTKLLIRRFVKNYEMTDDAEVRNSYGILAGITGIICNILLFAAKMFAGIISRSVSIIADSVNNLSDASSSVVSLLGFKFAQKPADLKHPYGHGRYEYVAGLTIAIMIVVIGIELLREGITKIISPSEVEFTAVTLVILVLSILLKLWMMLFNRIIGKKINSKTLIAAAADSRNDVISTTAVLIGAAVSYFMKVHIDGYIAVVVAVFIIVSGIGMIRETLDPIIGRAPDIEKAEEIRRKIMLYDGVLGAHDLMIHDYGVGGQFASVHVEMSAEGDVIEKHDIIDKIETDFLENENIHLIIHFDPIPSDDSAAGSLRRWIEGEVTRLDKRITIHDLKLADKNITLDCVVPQDIEIGTKEICRYISNITAEKYPDRECKVNIDRSFTEVAK